jgi:hypothetical protein
MLVTDHMLGLPEPIDRALELFATSKDELLTYLRELTDYQIEKLESELIREGVAHHAEFIVWYMEQNIASLPFTRTVALAAYFYKKIANKKG